MGRIVVTGIQHKREKGNEKREKRSHEFDFKRNVYGKGRRHGTDGLVCLAKEERGKDGVVSSTTKRVYGKR